ncbi:MAG: AI-2E family transporter [Planctomycetes bacterium]|nr:AI-2E family transporter [Planctomycetota bacterium]
MKPATGRTLFLLAVLLGVLWVGYLARAVVTPLVAALLLAYVLDPAVRRLQRLSISRNAASAIVVTLTFAAILGGGAIAATRVVQEAGSFYSDVVGEPAVDVEVGKREDDALRLFTKDLTPAQLASVAESDWDGRKWYYLDANNDGRFRPGIAREGIARIRTDLKAYPATAALAERIAASEDVGTRVATSVGSWLGAAAEAGQATAGTVLGLLTLVVLFPIYLYYSLARLGTVYDVTVMHLPGAYRTRIVDILGKIHITLSAFFRGRFILLVVRLVVLLIAFPSFGVPFGGVCAGFNAVASLVPVLGPVFGGAVPILLFLSSGASSGAVIGLVSVLVAYEVLEQYVLTPTIVGKRVGLHPLTILVATFVAGDLLGIFGMLVAIPLTAVLKIIAEEFVLPEVRRQAGLPPHQAACDGFTAQSGAPADTSPGEPSPPAPERDPGTTT